ncbi:MAG: hypothetical protein K9L21_02995 [Spirochaetia bacterium]|nr:hypothetical protein [Spirochaetia bacterium]
MVKKTPLVKIVWQALLLIILVSQLPAVTPLSEAEKFYSTMPRPVLPEDAVIGQIAEADPLQFSYEIEQILKQVFKADFRSGSGTAKELFQKHLSPKTGMMFLALNGETLFPLLPAKQVVTGEIREENGTARVSVRLLFEERSLTGDMFFEEAADGWKILSGTFDFSTDDY